MTPINSNEISRRDFIAILWATITALPFIYGAIRFILPPQKPYKPAVKSYGSINEQAEFDINSIAENSSRIINIDDEPVIIIRKTGTEITALSAECTHLSCIVGYRKGNNDLYCSCHGGRFGLDGEVLGGPPKKPLKKYKVEIKNNKILVTKTV
jgi:Rieske Fe-S protein